ncbi:MAG: hypothetical protein ACLQJ0_10305, partial [Steroidobacteraceae bacterium]
RVRLDVDILEAAKIGDQLPRHFLDGGAGDGWEVSHHFKPATSALGVYRPSAVTGATVEEVTGQLIAYLRGFQNINVEPNSRY